MRPRVIVIVEILFALLIANSLVRDFLMWDRVNVIAAEEGVPGFQIPFLIVRYGLWLLLYWFITRRRSIDAKWIYAALAGFGLIAAAFGMEAVLDQGPARVAISLVEDALTLATLILLFSPSANAWFGRKWPHPVTAILLGLLLVVLLALQFMPAGSMGPLDNPPSSGSTPPR